MPAADTSSLIAFFGGDTGSDVALVHSALGDANLSLPPIEPTPGYWVRAAATRALLIEKGLRPKVPDTLIAQSCIDHDVALITRDADFRHFAKHCGLRLA